MTFLKTSIASLVFAAASVCNAASVHIVFDNPIFNGSGSDNVTIKFANQNGIGSTTEYVAAGRFQGTGSNVVGVPTSIFVDGLSDLYMYCYDVFESISSGQAVDYTINLNGEKARTLDFLGAVNSVLSVGKTYDPYAWLHPLNASQGAAIQLGIWESLYDASSNWSMGTGTFQAWDLDGGTNTWLGKFFDKIDTTAALDGKYVMTFEARGAQDMIAGDPPANVPEPASVALVALGLAGIAAMRKRRQV